MILKTYVDYIEKYKNINHLKLDCQKNTFLKNLYKNLILSFN